MSSEIAMPPHELDAMFELAPVSLWLEDYSALKDLLDGWKSSGVQDVLAHLVAAPERVAACMAGLKVLRVNRCTLELFAAPSQEVLVQRLAEVFRGDMSGSVLHEIACLWQGQLDFSNTTVNYALDGRRLDVQVRVRVLPGHEERWDRVLVSLDDITARVRAERRQEESQRHSRDLFQLSPVSLWVEDFSAVKKLLDDIRSRGVSDFATFIKVHPEFVDRCMQEIRVVDVNRETLRMFGAPDKATLLQNVASVFRDEMHDSFAEQLRDLWDGRTQQQREVVNYALSGEQIHIHMQLAVMEDHLADWDLVLVSLVDITARKKAEAYLEYLGKHDVLTQLRNRAFYTEELNRLARKGPWPISILALDLNGLKQINDEGGHAAGDALLRRMGEVLGKAIDNPACAARIGGDEFAVLLPSTDERGALAVWERITALVDMNNKFHAGLTGHGLSVAMGIASCSVAEQLEATVARADRAMYENKAQHYRDHVAADRRNV